MLPDVEYIKIVYTAGYSVCPQEFVTAIKEILMYVYYNRGSEEGFKIPLAASLILDQVRDII